MQVFNTIDSSSFRYNGLKYAKNFMIIPQGVTGLGIYNAFDTSLQLIASAKFSDVQIDGIVYSSQTACVDVLAALIFYKPSGATGTGTASNAVDSVNGKVGVVVLDKVDINLTNVDNTSDANKPVSSAQLAALNLKANLASPSFTGTVSGITKVMVGLGNVDNISDANKPVSTTQQTALNLKANLASPTFTGTVSGITKAMVGLGNVDNISDANKPISTAEQTALNLKANLVSPSISGTSTFQPTFQQADVNILKIKNDASTDVITLDKNGFIKAARFEIIGGLGSDFLKADGSTDSTTYSNLGDITGTAGTIARFKSGGGLEISQITESAGMVVIGGSGTYTDKFEVIGNVKANGFKTTGGTASQFLKANGTVDSNVYLTGVTKAMVGLTNVDNTSDANKPVSSAQLAALNLKANLVSPSFSGTVSGITKAMVGLGNVDNISDANKPVSSAQLAALNLKANLVSPSISGTSTFQPSFQQADVNVLKIKNDTSTDVITLDKNGFIKAARFEIIGGLGSQFLKADGSSDSTTYSNLGDITGTAGTIARFKSGGGLEISQITESAGYVVVGGSGTYTDKFEVIGNVKANAFVGSGALLTGITKAMVGLGNVDNIPDSAKSVNYANSSGNATDSTKLPLSGGTLTGTLNGTVATFSSNIDSQYNYFAYVNRAIPSKINKRIGYAGDYQQHVILLHPIYNGTLIQYNECQGKITKRRGTTGAALSIGEFNIRSKSAYNTNNYGLSVDGTNGDLYTCTYQGVLYLALIPSYTVSAVEYGFDGYIVGDDNSLVIVNYRNSQTSTVLNPEINNSLTILTNYSTTNNKGVITSPTFFGSLLGLSSLNLPLSGGTLNGTLNGTAATFASSVTTGSDIFLGSGNASFKLDFSSGRGIVGYNSTYSVTGAIYIDGGAGNNKNVILNPVSTGNILVGTTTDNGSKFQVNGAATFASSVTNSSFFRVLSSSFSAPSSGTSLEIRNIAGVSSILSYDRTNSLYKSVIIDASDITLKYNGNDALTIANTGEATFASNVLSLGNISSTRTNPVLEAISNGASANRTRLAVATTAGAYTSTAAIGDSIISSSSHLIIATGAGSIERLRISNAGAATFAGTITAPSYAIYGGLGTQFLKADGSTDSTSYATLGDITGTAGTIARFKSGGGLEISQITESAGYVVVGGSGSYTDKFEVIGNVKANAFVGSGTLLTGITKSIVGLGNVDNTPDSTKSVDTAVKWAGQVYGGTSVITTPQSILTLDISNNTWKPSSLGAVKINIGLGNADNTSDANKPVSSAQLAALNLKANLVSPTFTGTVSGITKAMVGLTNVDNISDANKPVSSAQQSVLNLKANLASPTFTGTIGGISKAMVGLGNVDNIADSAKVVGSATTAGSAAEATNNYFYVRGTSPSIHFIDTDNASQSRWVHHNSGSIGFLNATSNWSLRCGDGEAQFYGTVTATNFIGPAQGLTGTAPNLVAGNVTINYFNNTNSTYQMLWGAGTGVYGTAGIYCNPSTNTFYTNGDIVAFAASDRRLKDNITPIPNALDKILKIGGYSFDWNDKQDVHTGKDIGVIAQEIEAVLPELVVERDNGYKAVKYEKLVALLIEGIKDQQKQIDNQQEQINELKTLIKN